MSDFHIDFVVLVVDGEPQQVFQFLDSKSAHRRDKHCRHAIREVLAHLLDKFVIEHITLGYGKHARLVFELGVEGAHLVEQDVVFLYDVVGVGRNHKQEHRIALDMAQEAQSQAPPFAGALDNSGDVCHHKRLIAAVAHNPEVGDKCGERVVGNFGFSLRNRR